MNGLLGFCFGILFTDFLLEAGASVGTIAALINTQAIITCLSYGLSGPLTARWGWRTVVMWSGILLSSGMAMTAFTPSVDLMFLSYAVMTGKISPPLQGQSFHDPSC